MESSYNIWSFLPRLLLCLQWITLARFSHPFLSLAKHMGSVLPFACKSSAQYYMRRSYYVHPRHSKSSINITQASALAMQEQERVANEEAEKRLKAALTAKREPASSASRVASPSLGNPSTPEPSSDTKPSTDGQQLPEDVSMEVDLTSTAMSAPEVSQGCLLSCSKALFNLAITESLASRSLCIIR